MIEINHAEINQLDDIIKIDAIAIRDEKRCEKIRISINQKKCLAAKIKDKIVGYLIYSNEFFGNNFIDLIVVDVSYRKKGIGSTLIRFYENVVKEGKIFTSTNKSNEGMQKLLLKLEYIDSGIIYNLDDNDPELVYFKYVKMN